MQLKWSTKAPMEYSFDRVPTMAPRSKSGIQWIVLAAFVLTIAWLATARADDILERSVSLHISASPLASALIEFSTQSGIQVAAADADVSHLNSNGVNGTFPIRAALSMLLHGTGLEFSRVGTETIAIRAASVGPAIGAVTRARGSGTAARMPAANSAQSDPTVNASALPEIPDVTVTAPRPPTDQELAGDSLYQFIVHHATVHYFNTGVTGNLAHWRGGVQSICPKTLGLEPGYNAFVTARLRALAANVGAPVQSDPQCKDNVRIVFTTDPRESMDNVVKWASVYFVRTYPTVRRLIAFKSDHAIQGWYITTRGGGRVLNTDVGLLGVNLQPLWPQIIPRTDGGDMSGIGVVILVIDTTKIPGYAIGTIADYVSVLALSVVQSPDHCDALPSILDVMSSSCGTREKPTAITAGDLAFLKALYFRKIGLGPSLSRDEIQVNMKRQFKGY
jgi:hypothetical protein